MADYNQSVKKLIQALNSRGHNLLYAKKQFMGKEGMPHNLFELSRGCWNKEKGKYDTISIYKTTSLIRMVLFLRDMWFTENGQDLPTDNEMWNQIREQIKLSQEVED